MVWLFKCIGCIEMSFLYWNNPWMDKSWIMKQASTYKLMHNHMRAAAPLIVEFLAITPISKTMRERELQLQKYRESLI